MTIYRKACTPEDFDLLVFWSKFSEDELKNYITPETKKILSRLGMELDDRFKEDCKVDDQNFSRLVGELATLLSKGSRTLGSALIKYYDYVDENEHLQAINELTYFIVNCKSRFYREIAIAELDRFLDTN